MKAEHHRAYIAAAPEQFREVLEHLRGVLSAALPEAEEMVAYGMPGFRIDGRVVASYAAFSRQCGCYFRPEALAAHAEEISGAGLKSTRTGVTFTVKNPIPDDLVGRLAASSRDAAETAT